MDEPVILEVKSESVTTPEHSNPTVLESQSTEFVSPSPLSNLSPAHVLNKLPSSIKLSRFPSSSSKQLELNISADSAHTDSATSAHAHEVNVSGSAVDFGTEVDTQTLSAVMLVINFSIEY